MKAPWLPALLLAGTLLQASALPQDGHVVQGQVQITPQGNVMEILQSGPRAIIDWNSFGIGRQEIVRFLQPDRSAAILNRVVGTDPSNILGQLTANGRIVLVNPNGILFGPGSVVDAGSFMASTLSMSNEDFLAGNYHFVWDGNTKMHALVNQGSIRVSEGGFLALVSPLVQNDGLLVARQGQVALAAGREATLNLDGQGLLELRLPDGFQTSTPLMQPETVLLTAGQMSDLLAGLVTRGNELEAQEGMLANRGQIQADGGGSVRLDSSRLTWNEGRISANGEGVDAGSVRLLSGKQTVNLGRLEARASGPGNAGLVEVSGAAVAFLSPVDVSAEQGNPGTLLLDPIDLHIVASGASFDGNLPSFLSTDGGALESVSATALALTAGPVSMAASRDIFVDPGVAVTFPNQVDVTMTAGRNITMAPGSSLDALNPSSTLSLITLTGAMSLRDIRFPKVTTQSAGALTLTGQFGRSGAPSNLQLGAQGLTTVNNVTLAGAPLNASISTNAGLAVTADARVDLPSSAANLTLQGSSVTFLGNNTIQGTGPINLTAVGNQLVQSPSGLTVDLPNPSSRVHLQETNPVAQGVRLTDTNLLVSNILLDAAGSRDVTVDGTLTMGVPGAPTVVTVNSGTLAPGSASNLTLVGSSVDLIVNLNAVGGGGLQASSGSHLNSLSPSTDITVSGNKPVRFFPGAVWSTTGAANITIDANDVRFDDDSGLSVAGLADIVVHDTGSFTLLTRPGASIVAPTAGSRLTVNATAGLNLDGTTLGLGDIRLTAAGMHFNNSTLGVPGQDSHIELVSSADTQFGNAAGTDVIVRGNHANFSVNASNGDLIVAEGTGIDLQTTSANVAWAAAPSPGGVIFAGNNSIHSNGPTTLTLRGETVNATGASLLLPATGSSVQLTATGDNQVGPIQTDSLALESLSGNITLTGSLLVNTLSVLTAHSLVAAVPADAQAFLAHHNVHVTAGNIFGSFTNPQITSALVFATDADATVEFTVTGSNDPALEDRAGSLFYRSPQSPNLTLTQTQPNRVDLVYEGSTNAAPTPENAAPTPEAPFQGRSSLSPEQLAALSRETAQSQARLGNLNLYRSKNELGGLFDLNHRDESLSSFAYLSPFSPVIETATLDPAAADEERRKHARESESPATQGAILLIPLTDDEADLYFWRQLLEGIVLWESDE